VLILAATWAGVAGTAAATPSATALAMVRASSSVVNVLCAGRGDGGGDGDGRGGSGRSGGCGGIPPPPNMGFPSVAGGGDTAGGRILLAGRDGTGGCCSSGLGLPEGPARRCCRASARLDVVARTGLRHGVGPGGGLSGAGAGVLGVSGAGIHAARSCRASACCRASSLASCSCCSRYSTRCCCLSACFWCSSAHSSTLP